MSFYILAPLARQDLEQIWDRIAEDDFDAADESWKRSAAPSCVSAHAR